MTLPICLLLCSCSVEEEQKLISEQSNVIKKDIDEVMHGIQEVRHGSGDAWQSVKSMRSNKSSHKDKS